MKSLVCEECGASPVMTKGGVCFTCNEAIEKEQQLPKRDIEFADLSMKPGALPRVRVVSPISTSWTSEAVS